MMGFGGPWTFGWGQARAVLGGGSGPASLLDTSGFTNTGNQAGHAEVLGIDSFRVCRNGGGFGALSFTLPAGTYRFTGTASAYDGAETGISSTRIDIQNGFSLAGRITSAGAFDLELTFTTNGRFFNGGSGQGIRIDSFNVVEV